MAAAAAFRERAALLTPDPARRASRLLIAARAKREAGAFASATNLLEAARAGPLTGLEIADVERLRGQIAATLGQNRNAGQLLLGAARLFEPFDVELARDTYLEALWEIAMWSGNRHDLRRAAARAARAAPAAPEPSRPTDVLLDALALRFTDGFVVAVPALTRALDRYLAMDAGSENARRLLWFTARPAGCLLAMELSDFQAWKTLTARNVQVARDAGAIVQLELGQHHLALFHIHQGDLEAAERLLAENRLIGEMTGAMTGRVTGMLLAAWRGDEARAEELIRAMAQAASARDAEVPVSYATLAGAVLHNGLGRYQSACEYDRQAFELDVFGVGPLAVTELARHPPEPGTARWPARRWSGWPAAGAWVRPIGRREWRPAPVLFSARVTRPKAATGSPLIASVTSASAPSWPAHTCSTENGYGARTGGPMLAVSCARRTRCSRPWGSGGSPSGRGRNLSPPGRPLASAMLRRPPT